MRDRLFSRMDLTPLVGVLLALFAVALTFPAPASEVDALELDHPGCFLPPPGGAPRFPPNLIVSLRQDGFIEVMGQRVSREAFAGELKHLASLPRQPGVWVRADADVDYGAVFALYKEIERAGLGAEIGIVNEDIE